MPSSVFFFSRVSLFGVVERLQNAKKSGVDTDYRGPRRKRETKARYLVLFTAGKEVGFGG